MNLCDWLDLQLNNNSKQGRTSFRPVWLTEVNDVYIVGSCLMLLYISSLCFSDKAFESAAPIRFTWVGRQTNAAATTGPAIGPLPASSTPIIYLLPFIYV